MGNRWKKREDLTYESGISTSLSSLEGEIIKVMSEINQDDVREAERIAVIPLPDESIAMQASTEPPPPLRANGLLL